MKSRLAGSEEPLSRLILKTFSLKSKLDQVIRQKGWAALAEDQTIIALENRGRNRLNFLQLSMTSA